MSVTAQIHKVLMTGYLTGQKIPQVKRSLYKFSVIEGLLVRSQELIPKTELVTCHNNGVLPRVRMD